MANSMTYDSKSFIAGNKRLFIHSAAIHYFRFPKEEWREVLWKAKLAGITCIDTYFAWNVHEPQEGIWNFEEEADCDAFLSLCHELGLQVIARPGPYICAEWDFGGFPWWLNNKEKMRYRAYDPRFLSYVDRYFDKLIPIIAKHQVTKGGSVILVQVENEYQHLASDEEGKEYLEYLRDGLRSRGIEVPLITCEGAVEGAVECANFWSGADRAYDKLRQKQPDTPKIVTEFWTGWFERWGGPRADHKTAALLERRIMEVLRAGFTGLNHYMFCGGTNFGSYGGRTVDASDVFNVTSYDYDAPLSEYLAYTPKYQAVKRLGYFIQSMYDFFVQSEERAADVKMSCEGRVRKRIHGETALYFVEHTSDERMSVHFTTETGETYQVTVNPGEIAPVLIDLPILSGWKLTYNAYLGGFHEIEGIPTLVVFSDEGQRSRMRFKTETELQFEAPASVLCYRGQEPGVLELELVHFETPQIIRLSDGIRQLRIIVVSTRMMDHVWWLPLEGKNALIIGADGIALENGKPRPEVRSLQTAEMRWYGDQNLFAAPSVQQHADGSCSFMLQGGTALDPLPKPAGWQVYREPLEPGADAVHSSVPLSFSALGQDFGYLLYSAEVHSEEDRWTTMVLPYTQDPVRVFVNGGHRGILRDTFGTSVQIPLAKGKNRIDLLVQHMGRFNFSFYLGEPKGIYGPVFIDGRREDLRRNWQAPDGHTVHLDQVHPQAPGMKLRRTFRASSDEQYLIIGEFSEELYINGKKINLSPYRSWYKICSADLTPYIREGENTIEMVCFRTPAARLELLAWKREEEIAGWQMRPIKQPPMDGAWEELHSDASLTGPAWFRCRFSKPSLPKDVRAKLKLRLTGLSKGALWVNERNIGRYWQIGPQEDYKIPLEWLEEENQLLIFDEEGRIPDRIEWLWENISYVR